MTTRFIVEDLRPIQLSRFDFEQYCANRAEFSRDEWIDVICAPSDSNLQSFRIV